MDEQRLARWCERQDKVCRVLVQDGSELVAEVPILGIPSVRILAQTLEDAATLAGKAKRFTLTATRDDARVIGQTDVFVRPVLDPDEEPSAGTDGATLALLAGHCEKMTRHVVDVSEKMVGQAAALLEAQSKLLKAFEEQATNLAQARLASYNEAREAEKVATQALKLSTEAVAMAESASKEAEKPTSSMLQETAAMVFHRFLHDRLGPEVDNFKAWMATQAAKTAAGVPGNGAGST